MPKRIVVFCENTISHQNIAKIFPNHLRQFILNPPATQGDVWRHIREDVKAIILVDCTENAEENLWYREITDALKVHIKVIGTGKIGSLLARELQHKGMEGVGEYYNSTADTNGQTDSADSLPAEVTRRDAVTAIKYAITALTTLEHSICGTFASSLEEQGWRKNALNLRPCVIEQEIVYGAEILHHFLQFASPDALAEIATKMHATFYTLEWARQTHTICPHEIRTAIFERERERLHDIRWLLSNGLMQCEYASLLEQEALLHYLSSSPWHTYVEAWAKKAGIIKPSSAHSMSTYEWVITKNPAFFGYVWESEVGLWDWLQRNKRVADITRDIISLRS